MAARILVVEDEPAIQELIAYSMRQAGHAVFLARSAEEAMDIINDALPDLLLLDWMLPGMSGVDFARMLRRASRTKTIPIIMLTARVEETDKLIGLEIGADDYITKPFSPRELVARVKVILRRVSGDATAEVIRVGNVSLDRTQYEVQVGKRVVILTPTEFEIMATLMSQPNRIFSRHQLLNAAHGVAFESYERAIDSHIRNLRHKLEPDELIFTVHGVGYKFEA